MGNNDMTEGLGLPAGRHQEAVSLCAAVRQVIDELQVAGASRAVLLDRVAAVDRLARDSSDDDALLDAARSLRHGLTEFTDGPLVPFLVDAAALVVGDDNGRIFFLPV